MIRVTLTIDAPIGNAQGYKEAIAQDLEKYGAVRVVRVEDIVPRQGSLFTEEARP